MKIRLVDLLLVIMLLIVKTPSVSAQRYASESILDKGKWIKIRIDSTAIYKITYPDLKKLGFPDPSKVTIHGYGGWPLEEDFNKPYMDDLPQVSVWRGEDYLLFYGKGPRKWEYVTDTYNSNNNRFIHTNNPYADFGYYFLTDSIELRKIERVPSETEAAERITTFDDYILHERDMISINKSGRELFGESLSSGSLNIKLNDIEGITNDIGKAEFRFIAKVNQEQTVSLMINDKPIASGSVYKPNSGGTETYVKARDVNAIGSWSGESGKLDLKLQFSQKNNNTAYLDFIRLHFKRELIAYNQPFTFFRNILTSDMASRFVIQNANERTLIFDITDGVNMKIMETALNDTELSFTIPKGNTLREFVIVQPEKTFPTIDLKNAKEIKNQNLHGLSQRKMIIISPFASKSEAQRLAAAHEEKDGFTTHIVTPEEIYNEFSSGTPDATAYRRFVKMFYDRSITEGTPPEFLLLFGDGTFDNRFLTANWSNEKNKDCFLLTYQTNQSLNYESHVVDDYFGFLDDNEGAIIENAKVDIGIGRFPVRTQTQAKQMVDKVINYMNTSNGAWKNKLCFIADDGSNDDSFAREHQTLANQLADKVEAYRPEYIVNKILFDMYNKDHTSGFSSYPQVNIDISKKLNEGLFLINYVGHGNTESLSDERVITKTDIARYNFSDLPIWVTSTCDFCRFDDISTSAGEEIFLNPKSGGIALFTTSRVAFRQSIDPFNNSLINAMFSADRNPEMTLGKAIRDAKNNYNGDKTPLLGICLIGDPALKLYYPQNSIQITSVNGNPVGGDIDTLRAKEKTNLSGKIYDANGNIKTDFNGYIDITIFDNIDEYITLGNNKDEKGDIIKINYKDYKGLVYTGKSLVKNGEFDISFVVSQFVQYSRKNHGKISMYAYDETQNIDAQGYFLEFQVAGDSKNPVVDTTNPEIRQLFLNDSTFTDGDKVNNTPFFYAKVWDQSGINITGSSIGHDITLIIDNKTYILNNYYESSFEVEGEGTVQFSIPELSEGIHKGELIVWDVLSNPARREFSFEVANGVKPNIYEIIATPNPAKESVQFRLFHNRPESLIHITIDVFDLAGRSVWKYNESGYSSLFKDYPIYWDLTSHSGGRIRPGIYLYKATIKTKSSSENTKAEKMIILGP